MVSNLTTREQNWGYILLHHWTKIGIVAVIVAVLSLSACGSSSKSAGSTSKSTGSTSGSGITTGKTLSGKPVVVGLITELTGSLAQPFIKSAAEVGVDAVNATDGVDGHPVKVDVCDDQSTQQGAQLCAQKLLEQDKVLMLVGDDAVLEQGILPIVAAAHTIDFSTLAACTPCVNNADSYILQPLFIQFDLLPKMIPTSDTKIAYFVSNNAVAVQAAESNKSFYPKGDAIKLIQIPFTATDFSSSCLQAKEMGAQVGVLELSPSQEATLVQTCDQLGLSNLTWAGTTSTLIPQLVQTFASLRQKNVYAVDWSQKAYQEFDADIAKYGSKVGGISERYSDEAVGAWAGIKLLPELVQGGGGVGKATGSSIQAWLNKQTAFNTEGLTPPIDFAATPIPSLSRVKNVDVYKGTVNADGQLIVASSTPLSLTGNIPGL